MKIIGLLLGMALFSFLTNPWVLGFLAVGGSILWIASAGERGIQRRSDEIEAERLQRLKREAAFRAQREAEARAALRDAERQDTPYTYQCKGHPNSTLALRYGIANLAQHTEEYWYFAKGGEQKRNPARDRKYMRPSDTIRLRKLERVDDSTYIAELPDFASRRVRVVIETGAEFVKTFLPMHEDWFHRHADLERVLKDNPTFSLKELATFHVQKAVSSRGHHEAL